jgi:gamma-glutamyltranspeptidase/glutathione hydrolase
MQRQQQTAISSVGPSTGSRSPVMTRNGIVCSVSPLAASAGVRVLQEGGNAFDAAIAVAAAEAVTLPPMCGIGGEVFALLYQASTGKLHGLTGSGRAPQAATRDYFMGKGYSKMPPHGPLTPAVPGEVHAWQTILDNFGTRSLASLMEPAIDLAENGFPIASRISTFYTSYIDKLREYPSTVARLTRNGQPFQAGDVLVQADLARSLKRIAENGPREFYEGALAKELASAIQAAGGLITTDDLARHDSVLYDDPPSVTYRGHTVATNALPSQGLLILELLNIMEGFDLAGMGHNSADAIHAVAEAKKLAFADRLAYVGDAEFVATPLDALLSKEFAAERRRNIDMKHASKQVTAGALPETDGDTSYFCVVDAQGNAVSFIHSLSMYFGSGFIAGDTGILLNDRVGRGFYLDEGHPNVVAPGKRTINTIQTWMALKDGVPVLLGGTPGGDRQPPWNAQIISNVLDFGMGVQEAAEAPRWNHFPGSDPATVEQPYQLKLEDGVAQETVAELERRGHSIVPMSAGETPGAVQLIAIDPVTGVRTGGSDPRADGYPVAH